ncbi:hypothetical protein CKJ67_26505 (plasmid) [Mycobacterium intracellulare]|uniref:Lipoprotein LpqS n=1 Tax=Mycobacterium kiyosense TaxID=2871094 RepID=A0AA37PZV8_9MYCO|nr:hypothetical protein CKJ67_26505 [Mycobacterium intracellulare]ELR81307.1 lipoprotein LpqS [Mycobacterium sp. H4Y]PBJ44042.1 hypothetical protein BI294_00560 [Mycobacterium avium subsp. hominissuis]BCO86724.1 lipoprotein LpqS [Mycobacterium paraintracellulare]GLB85633.1 lipoprotein LpqS [Mycobacterium kiyosense]
MVAVVAALWMAGWLLVIGAHNVVGGSQSAVSQPAAHALVSSLDGGFAVNADYPHLDNGSSTPHPEQFMTAVLPQSAAAAAALGVVVVAAAAVAGWLTLRGVPAGRGPPAGSAAVVTGQDRLTRFCLSRR